MKLPVLSGLAALSAIVGIAAVSKGQPRPIPAPRQEVRQQRPPISLEELADRGIVGSFGYPLGTIIELRGTVIPNPQLGKGDSGDPIAQVGEINGRLLDKPMVTSRIRFPSARGADPRVGDQFHAFGYETGEYSGIVPGAAKFEPPRQDRGFGFTTRFLVLKLDWTRRP